MRNRRPTAAKKQERCDRPDRTVLLCFYYYFIMLNESILNFKVDRFGVAAGDDVAKGRFTIPAAANRQHL